MATTFETTFSAAGSDVVLKSLPAFSAALKRMPYVSPVVGDVKEHVRINYRLWLKARDKRLFHVRRNISFHLIRDRINRAIQRDPKLSLLRSFTWTHADLMLRIHGVQRKQPARKLFKEFAEVYVSAFERLSAAAPRLTTAQSGFVPPIKLPDIEDLAAFLPCQRVDCPCKNKILEKPHAQAGIMETFLSPLSEAVKVEGESIRDAISDHVRDIRGDISKVFTTTRDVIASSLHGLGESIAVPIMDRIIHFLNTVFILSCAQTWREFFHILAVAVSGVGVSNLVASTAKLIGYLSAFPEKHKEGQVHAQSDPKAEGILTAFVGWCVSFFSTTNDSFELAHQSMRAKRISETIRVVKDLSSFKDVLIDIIPYSVEWIAVHVFRQAPAASVSDCMEGLVGPTVFLKSVVDNNSVLHDAATAVRLAEVKAELESWHKLYSRTPFFKTPALVNQYTNAATLLGRVDAMMKMAERFMRQRERPVVILMTGGPGAGKSVFLEQIAYALMGAENLECDRGNMFTVANGQAYFDGYRGQLVYVLDDWGYTLDATSRNLEVLNFLHLANEARMHLDMSKTEDKSITYFCSPYVIMTTNLRDITQSAQVANGDAILRRIDITIDVQKGMNGSHVYDLRAGGEHIKRCAVNATFEDVEDTCNGDPHLHGKALRECVSRDDFLDAVVTTAVDKHRKYMIFRDNMVADAKTITDRYRAKYAQRAQMGFFDDMPEFQREKERIAESARQYYVDQCDRAYLASQLAGDLESLRKAFGRDPGQSSRNPGPTAQAGEAEMVGVSEVLESEVVQAALSGLAPLQSEIIAKSWYDNVFLNPICEWRDALRSSAQDAFMWALSHDVVSKGFENLATALETVGFIVKRTALTVKDFVVDNASGVVAAVVAITLVCNMWRLWNDTTRTQAQLASSGSQSAIRVVHDKGRQVQTGVTIQGAHQKALMNSMFQYHVAHLFFTDPEGYRYRIHCTLLGGKVAMTAGHFFTAAQAQYDDGTGKEWKPKWHWELHCNSRKGLRKYSGSLADVRIVKCHDYDVAFFHLPTLEDQVNITGHFVHEETLGRPYRYGTMLTHPWDRVQDNNYTTLTNMYYSDRAYTYGGTERIGHDIAIAKSIVSRGDTNDGECGAPMVVEIAGIQETIGGMHVAGGNGLAVSVPLSQEFVRTHVNLANGITAQSGAYMGRVKLEVRDTERAVHLATTKLHVPSAIFPTYQDHEVLKEHSRMSPERTGLKRSPLMRGLERMTRVHHTEIDPEAFAFAGDALAAALPQKSPNGVVLTEHQVLNGIPGLYNAMNFHSGSGYPYAMRSGGTSGKLLFVEGEPGDYRLNEYGRTEVELMRKRLKMDPEFRVVYIAYIKAELLKKVKVENYDSRLTLCASFTFLYLAREQFGTSLIAMEAEHLTSFCAVGFNPHSQTESACFASRLHMDEEGWNYIGTDVSNNDGDQCLEVGEEVARIFSKWSSGDEEVTALREAILRQDNERCVLADGKLMYFEGGVVTGGWKTAQENSMRIYFAHAYAYHRSLFAIKPHLVTIDMFQRLVVPSTYGDDLLSAVHESIPEFNQISMASHAKELNLTLTDSEKSTNMAPYVAKSGMSFLKRYPRQVDGKWTWALDQVSLTTICQYVSPKLDVFVATRDNCNTAMNEYFYWGQQVYNAKLHDLNQRLEIAGIARLTCTFARTLRTWNAGMLSDVLDGGWTRPKAQMEGATNSTKSTLVAEASAVVHADRNELTTFFDQEATVSSFSHAPRMASVLSDPYQLKVDQKVFEREYLVLETSAATTAVTGTQIALIQPFALLLTQTKIADALSHWVYMCWESIDVTVIASVAGTFMGSMLLSWVNGGNLTDPTFSNTPYSDTFGPHVIIPIQASPAVTVTIPWGVQKDRVNLATQSGFEGGVFKLSCLTPFVNISATPSTTFAVTIYCKFNKVCLSGPCARAIITPLVADLHDDKDFGVARKVKAQMGVGDATDLSTAREAGFTTVLAHPANAPSNPNGAKVTMAAKENEQKDESKSLLPSKVLGGVGGVATALGFIPVIGPVMRVVGLFFALFGGIARLFGKANQISVSAPMYTVHNPSAGAANVDRVVMAEALTLSMASRLSDTNDVRLDYADNMMLHNFLSHPCCIDTGTIPSTAAYGTVITSWMIGPMFVKATGTTTITYNPTRMSHIGKYASYWGGGIRFLIYIYGNPMIKCRIRIGYLPNTETVGTTFTSNEGDIISYVYDISGETVIPITMPYLSDKPLLPTGFPVSATTATPNAYQQFSSGTLFLALDSPVLLPTVTTAAIGYSVHTSIAPDFRYSRSRRDPQNASTLVHAQMGGKAVSSPASFMTGIPDLISRGAVETMLPSSSGIHAGFVTPDNIGNMKDLIGKFTAGYYTGGATMQTCTGGYYLQLSRFSSSAMRDLSSAFRYRRGSVYLRGHITYATPNTYPATLYVASLPNEIPISLDNVSYFVPDVHGAAVFDVANSNSFTVALPQYGLYPVYNLLPSQPQTTPGEELVYLFLATTAAVTPTLYLEVCAGDDFTLSVPTFPGTVSYVLASNPTYTTYT